VTRPIELRIPNERPFHGVARLVIGGLAARHNLSYEALEDLQLALATILESDGFATEREIGIQLAIGKDTVAMSIGPLDGDALRRELDSVEGGRELGLSRLLRTLVEEVGLEGREDGDWLRLEKRVRGVRPAGANA
jgi:hypothetical protein